MNEPLEVHLEGRFGTPLRHLTVTDSTNARALAWAAQGAPEGAVVVADEQTAGRGRHGRRWDSGAGQNLLMSVVLRPRLAPQRLGLVTVAAGVAVVRGIEAMTGKSGWLKWPNDVLIGDRKVAGILTEGTLVGSELRAAVVGIGINTHWQRSEIPTDLVGRATSVAIEMGDRGAPRRAQILGRVLVELEEAYDRIHADPGVVLDEARARSAVLGRHIEVTWPDGRTASGRATGIRGDGALEVEVEGAIEVLYAADVERIRSRET